MKQPVTFKNSANQTLFGILHIPESPHKSGKRIGVNILNPGLKNRVAPNRLNVKIARLLCEKGFYVFRFDPHGIGDSEGELPDEIVLELWGSIQQGRFVEDTICSNNFFMNKCSLDELVMIGSCGGAVTAFFTGAIDDRVTRLMLIDLPVIFSSRHRTFKDMINSSKETSKIALKKYISNALTKPKSWINFITGKSEYDAIFSIFKKKLRIKITNQQDKTYDDIYFNKDIPLCFNKLISRKVDMSFILADTDTGTQIFQDRFEKTYILNNYKARKVSDVFIIEKANHIYTIQETQDILLSYILKKLQRNFQ